MKIQDVYRNFQEAETYLFCPICHENLEVRQPGSLLCATGHCFDLSTKNYVNFATGSRQNKYGKQLFENRRRLFRDGFYQPVLQELDAQLTALGGSLRILDAGCGEGYYAASLSSQERLCFALDLVKDAVALAASGNRQVKWMVADLARIPLQDHSMDVILNILTPANYQEFLRVLRPDGLLLKVVPGTNYLREIRECLSGRLQSEAYSNERVLSHLKDSMHINQRKQICYQLPVTPSQRDSFLQMTPMLFNVPLSELSRSDFSKITIDLDLIIASVQK